MHQERLRERFNTKSVLMHHLAVNLKTICVWLAALTAALTTHRFFLRMWSQYLTTARQRVFFDIKTMKNQRASHNCSTVGLKGFLKNI
jgi:hypothetical protein